VPDGVPEFLRFVGDVLKIILVVTGELPGTTIEPVQTTTRSNPENARRIFEERYDPVIVQTRRIVWIVLVNRNTIPIIFIQPIIRAKPHEALTVLENAVDCAVGESVFYRKVGEFGVFQYDGEFRLGSLLQ
jgi:hypothetical protein